MEFLIRHLVPSMAGRFPPHIGRSKDAPMDYQWTNRSPVKPAWATRTNEPSTPPKPFPLPAEVKDIDMTEISPIRNGEKANEMESLETNDSNDSIGPVAAGGLQPVLKRRNKRHELRPTAQRRSQEEGDVASASGSDSDHEKSVTPMNQTTSHHYTLNMPAPAPPPSELPYILLGYLQFFFNLSLILIFLYLFVQFIITVQRDVEHRIAEYQQDVIQEISICATHYKNNLCATSPIPALIQQCANWETCMNRDPVVVGRAKVGAELIAEVINGFVEPISWKTLIFTLTSLAFLTVFINTLLSLYRSKHHPIPESPRHPTPHFPIAPSIPFPQNMDYLSPAPMPSWGRHRTGQDIETRRLEGGTAVKIK